jgi:prevent-host-death family protein
VARRHSIADARSNLPKLVRDAEAGKTVELTRRGEPVAVLIGRKHYERLTSELRSFSEVYATFVRDVGLRELAIDPDEIFSSVRDEATGREVSL